MRVKRLAHMNYKKMMLMSSNVESSHVDMASVYLVYIASTMLVKYCQFDGVYRGYIYRWMV